MLPRPKIIEMPNAVVPSSNQLIGCSDGYKKSDGSTCNNGFECNPYKDVGCQDSTYCGAALGIGIVGAILVIT